MSHCAGSWVKKEVGGDRREKLITAGMGGDHTVETPLIRNIINQQYAHGAPVVRRRDGAEPFLPRGVPYLQLDALAVELDGADLEVDADGRDEGGREGVFAEAQEAAGFAHAGVAY